MGKSTPSPPPAPDAAKIAGAQGAANVNSSIASQILNQTGQTTPYGSVSYNQTGTYTLPDGTPIPQFNQNVALSPAQQAILDKTQGLQSSALDTGGKAIQNVANTIGQPFSLKGLPKITNNKVTGSFENPGQQMGLDLSSLPGIPGIGDFGAQRDAVQNALMSRFNEDIGRREEDLISRLNAEGIQRGSEGYGTAMQQVDRARNDALTQAILAGGAEQQRLFDMASQARGQMYGETLGAGEFANQAAAQQFGQNQGLAAFKNAAAGQQFTQDLANRQQALNEQTLARNQPINEFATLFGLGSNVQMPGGAGQTGVGVNPADILGANSLQYQALMNTYNQQMANRSANAGALGMLGGMLGGGLLGNPGLFT
jgi:hypothetical protein